MVQLGGFVDKILRPLMKTCLSLLGNVLKLLAKSALVPLGLPLFRIGWVVQKGHPLTVFPLHFLQT